MGLSLYIAHVKEGELKQAGSERRTENQTPPLFSCPLRVLPAINDDSDNKSARDLSDSELCGVTSASEPNTHPPSGSVSKGGAAVNKHAQYFTLI